MKKAFLITIVFFAMVLAHPVCAGSIKLIPPPSQEELDRLYELGRQNELKYGSGTEWTPAKTGAKTPSVKVSPKPTPSPSPELSPEPTASPIPSIAPTPTPEIPERMLLPEDVKNIWSILGTIFAIVAIWIAGAALFIEKVLVNEK